MGLGADIKTALDALSEADKGDAAKCWDAIGEVIEVGGYFDLDDIDDGIDYQRVIASFVDANGKIEKIKSDCALENNVTRYKTVSALAFGCNNYDNPPQLKFYSGRCCNMTGGDYVAGIQLPHGAIVTKVRGVWSQGTSVLTGRLTRHEFDAGIGQDIMATVVGASGGEDTSIDYATIDNSAYFYHLLLNVAYGAGNYPEFTGFQVTYTIAKPLP